jgi:hypothetical protein
LQALIQTYDNVNECIDKLGKILKQHVRQKQSHGSMQYRQPSRSEAARTEIPRSADVMDGDVRACYNHGVMINAGKDSLCR